MSRSAACYLAGLVLLVYSPARAATDIPIIAAVGDPYNGERVATAGDRAFYLTRHNVYIFRCDVSQTKAHLIGRYMTFASIVDVAAMGSWMAVLRTDGLQVVDISDPSRPRRHARFTSITGEPVAVDFGPVGVPSRDQRIAVVCRRAGGNSGVLHIFSAPPSVQHIAQVNLRRVPVEATCAYDQANGRRCVFVGEMNGFECFELVYGTPGDPTTETPVRRADVANNLGRNLCKAVPRHPWVALANDTGWAILDFSDPEALQIVPGSQRATNETKVGIAVCGSVPYYVIAPDDQHWALWKGEPGHQQLVQRPQEAGVVDCAGLSSAGLAMVLLVEAHQLYAMTIRPDLTRSSWAVFRLPHDRPAVLAHAHGEQTVDIFAMSDAGLYLFEGDAFNGVVRQTGYLPGAGAGALCWIPPNYVGHAYDYSPDPVDPAICLEWELYDVSDPANPRYVSGQPLEVSDNPLTPEYLFFSNEQAPRAIIAGWWCGVKVYDLSDVTHPQRLVNVDCQADCAAFEWPWVYAYDRATDELLRVNCGYPPDAFGQKERVACPAGARPDEIAVSGQMLFIARGGAIEVYQLGYWLNDLQLLCTVNSAGAAACKGLEVHGRFLAALFDDQVAGNPPQSRLQVYDISGLPSQPPQLVASGDIAALGYHVSRMSFGMLTVVEAWTGADPNAGRTLLIYDTHRVYGQPVRGDINGNGVLDWFDLGAFIGNWGPFRQRKGSLSWRHDLNHDRKCDWQDARGIIEALLGGSNG